MQCPVREPHQGERELVAGQLGDGAGHRLVRGRVEMEDNLGAAD